MRLFLLVGLLCSFVSIAAAQAIPPSAPVDSDRDGLSDELEDALLGQFVPRFMIGDDDCSVRPAQFVPMLSTPTIKNENGTIYGQAFPREGHSDQVELHYYHLWRQDCGELSHPLDAEHVSALVVRGSESNWKALYWYAAAHENTLCDASQFARAAAVDGERHGPEVWISRGKHGSFLSSAICEHGCGGDSCSAMQPLARVAIINLGEPSRAMNGATWADSPLWPLAGKMGHSDFAADRTAHADTLAASAIAWASPGKRRMQSTIRVADSVRGSTAGGLNATGAALDTAGPSTGNALDSATADTGNGLAKSARGVKRALRATARKLGLAD